MIKGFGYKRFLFAGSENEWIYYLDQNETHYKIIDFFSCEVFHTLLMMGVFIIPPIYYAIIYWPVITRKEKYAHLFSMIFEVFKIIIIGSLVYATFILYIATPAQLSQLSTLNDFDFLIDYFNVSFFTDLIDHRYNNFIYTLKIQNITTFGYWSPLIGFVFAEIGFFSLVIIPHLFTVPTTVAVKKNGKIKVK